MIDYKLFQGRIIEDIADYIPDKSHYCNNYYIDVLGNEIFAQNDDDNYTAYYYNGTQFAESFTSKGDLIEVFDEYLNKR